MKIRYVVYGILAISLGVLVAYRIIQNNNKDNNTKGGPGGGSTASAIRVNDVVVQPQRFASSLSVSGSIEANEQVQIRSQVSGLVRSISFREGGLVKKGQVLIGIDNEELRAQLSQALTHEQLSAANEERARKLLAIESISQQEYDVALADLKALQAQTRLVRAQLGKTVPNSAKRPSGHRLLVLSDCVRFRWANIFLPKPLPLANLVTITEQSSPPQLYHSNRFLSATVSAGLTPGNSIGDGIEAMDRIAERVLDDSFSTDLGGESRDFQESGSNTLFAFGLALLLIYLILAAQFESFMDPLIIILTVPVAGALLSLWLTGQTWNIFSQIGTIMLIGLVTKNGILIVEFANQLRGQGKSRMEASESRLRPILMTSLTVALGALPIAVAFSAAAQSRMGMGIVIVGGTMFSLLLTLFIIPAVYAMWSRDRKHRPELERTVQAERRQAGISWPE